MKYLYNITLLFSVTILAQSQPEVYLTQKDRDSIYGDAFKDKLVTENIGNNFSSPGLLYTREYDLELKSTLLSPLISSDIKKKLLINRIIADYKKYGGQNNSNNVFYELATSRQEALNNFRKTDNSVFSWMLYVVNGVPVAIVNDLESLQELTQLLNKMEITQISFMTDQPTLSRLGFHTVTYGVIIIRGTKQ